MVTNPATRDWTVTAVDLRHAQRDVRQPHDLRHRPRRLRGPRDQRQADHARRRCARRSHVIRGSANGAQRRVQGQPTAVPVGHRQSRSRCGSPPTARKALAAHRRGRATGSSSSWPTPTSPSGRSRPCEKAAADAGRDPDDVTICVAAPAYVGATTSPTPATSAAGSAAWSATTWPTSSPATAPTARTCPRRSPTTSRAARATTTTSTAGPATRTPRSCPTRSSTASASSAPSSEHLRRLDELRGARRRPVRHLPATRRQGRDAAGLRRARHPGDGRASDRQVVRHRRTGRRARGCGCVRALAVRPRAVPRRCLWEGYKWIGTGDGRRVARLAAARRDQRPRDAAHLGHGAAPHRARSAPAAGRSGASVLGGAWYSFRSPRSASSSASPSASLLAIVMRGSGSSSGACCRS